MVGSAGLLGSRARTGLRAQVGASVTRAPFGNIGAKLRQARRAKRLRLQDVAERVGCSEGMISKIERDRVTPSLRMLHRLTEVLETSLKELFADPEEGDLRIYRKGERPTIHLGSAEAGMDVALERMVPHVEDAEIDGNVHVIGPGASNGGVIKHSGQEVGYVLEGELELTVDDRVHHLTAGDSFFFRSTLPHGYRNTSAGVTRVLWVNAPPTI